MCDITGNKERHIRGNKDTESFEGQDNMPDLRVRWESVESH